MEILDYISKKKELYELFLNFIDNEDDSEQDYIQNIKNNLSIQKKYQNKYDLKEYLNLVIIIMDNHHRLAHFFRRIEQFLLLLKDDLKQTFSNIELFNLCKSNKRFLLLLFDNEIITIDKSIADAIDHLYPLFFYEEIKNFLSEERKQEILKNIEGENLNFFTNFDEKRHNGENDSYICSLIRHDSINEFIVYVNKNMLSPSQKVEKSIFETNSFLIGKDTSLIEYAAFFGAIQIFQYLILNNADLSPDLWFYSIHSNNPHLIHLLEINGIEPKDKSYRKCIEESIKCHHNDFVNYIESGLMNKNYFINYDIFSLFNESTLALAFHYINYYFIPENYKNRFMLHYACQNDYYNIVQLLLNTEGYKVRKEIIFILL